jgi:very-short-patch-repair endonuclease
MNYLTARAFAREMRKHPTKAEDFFWQKVRGRQLAGAKYHRQYVFEYATLEQRKSYFIVDFYCPAHRLIVEIDGPIHALQAEYDRFRETILTSSWPKSILRFTNEEILGDWSKVSAILLDRLRSD